MLFAIAAAPSSGALVLNSNALDTNLFRVSVFATGLSGPISVQQLPDGSTAVATWNSIQRFTDANHDGVADGPGTTLFSVGAGPTVGLQKAGKYYVSAIFGDHSIRLLEPGASPSDPWTSAATMSFNYPAGWYHPTPGIAVRATPGSPGSFDVVFNVGSQYNSQVSTGTVGLSGLYNAALDGDSLYMITIDETGAAPAASNLRKVATGIRNVMGMAFDAAGNFYFADNAIDGPGPDGDEPVQADELNRIDAGDLGVLTPDFGYPTCYTAYRTGGQVGSGCVSPLVTFQPLPNGTLLGSESEGPAEIAFGPAGFPTGFNNGMFVGFSGKGYAFGPANEENAVVYYDFGSGKYIHFVENSLPGVGQPIGLFSDGRSLFISDYAAGTVYLVESAVPEPTAAAMTCAGMAVLLLAAVWRRAVARPKAE